MNTKIRKLAVRQLLVYAKEERKGETELLMKEVWEDCNTQSDFDEVNKELDLLIEFLDRRMKELEEVSVQH